MYLQSLVALYFLFDISFRHVISSTAKILSIGLFFVLFSAASKLENSKIIIYAVVLPILIMLIYMLTPTPLITIDILLRLLFIMNTPTPGENTPEQFIFSLVELSIGSWVFDPISTSVLALVYLLFNYKTAKFIDIRFSYCCIILICIAAIYTLPLYLPYILSFLPQILISSRLINITAISFFSLYGLTLLVIDGPKTPTLAQEALQNLQVEAMVNGRIKTYEHTAPAA